MRSAVDVPINDSVDEPRPAARTRVRVDWVRALIASLSAVTLAVGATACGPSDAVRVRLEAHPASTADGTRLQVNAQVAGPPDGLRYRWHAVAGECDPQESSTPSTEFHFADGTRRDRVAVEVWRDGRRVAEHAIAVQVDPRLTRLVSPRTAPAIRLEVTEVPPYDPGGGPDTRADIAGRVTGDVPPGHQVLVYARADAWYIQPMPNTAHALAPGGTWRTWTHTGSSYAVLLVRPGAAIAARLDVLPQVGGDVLARTVVEGATR